MPNPNIDTALAQQLLCASIQTYRAYDAGAAFAADPLKFVGSPKGLTYVESFAGQDDFDSDPIHPLVLFGLIFSVDAKPGCHVFAFRGTKGIDEWIDDIDVARTGFSPSKPSASHPLPADAYVEKGFWKIYHSLQQSLFETLAKLGTSELLITGHSLGSSISELFTLDVAISSSVPFTTYNFACPRTGNAEWARFYDSLTKDAGNPTVRVVNTKDLVPKVPPEGLGYSHVGVAYDICFESEDRDLIPNYGLRHSADNYARTLAHVLGTSQTCQLQNPPDPELEFC